VAQETETIASEFFAAIARGDLHAVRELYSPEAEIWHNVTAKTQTRAENLSLLRYFTARVSELRYEVLAREFFEGGFVQRHILHGRLESGDLIAAPVCLVVYVSRGKITRLFEYLDPAASALPLPRFRVGGVPSNKRLQLTRHSLAHSTRGSVFRQGWWLGGAVSAVPAS